MLLCFAAVRLIFFSPVLFIISAVEYVFFFLVCQSTVYCLAACVFDVKRGRTGSISTHGDSLCAHLQCCIETKKLKSKVDALNDNAVILSKSLLSSSSSSSSSSTS